MGWRVGTSLPRLDQMLGSFQRGGKAENTVGTSNRMCSGSTLSNNSLTVPQLVAEPISSGLVAIRPQSYIVWGASAKLLAIRVSVGYLSENRESA
jgi:hypothetical protein